LKQNLALFDFDGTISKKDSMREFLKFYYGNKGVYKAYLANAHWLTLMFVGLIDKGEVKEKIWIYLFNNILQKEFENKAHFFSTEILPTFLYQQAIEKITEHRNRGDRLIIVSASAEEWLKPWCQLHKIELIATQLEKKDGKLTGKMASKNCKGPEKIRRIKELLDFNDYQSIYAYGDSDGDKEMLSIATFPFYRKFKK
jgi:HAD superfamily hydrolase (TIGR01490 family)